ncbi:MAG: C4-type zinc ribbon domain-containing protein [Desulfobacterales bacterium]|nr:C4-type zinc ribbon domain-containing protein [Desulfobacterales bacterium]
MVKKQLQLLWKLQTLERQIEEAQKEKESCPVTLESLQGLLKAQEEKKEEEKRRIEELEKERVRLEGELEMESERTKRSQLKLLEIKTNKEYQALLKEIEMGKEHNSQREEDIIRMLDEIDRLKTDYASTVERAHKERKEIEEEQEKVREQMVTVEQNITHWHHNREEIVRELDPELLKRYTVLKERRNGIAVVLVKNEGCQGCYVNIPPQMYNEVQKNKEIIVCPNCHRILYWENKGAD